MGGEDCLSLQDKKLQDEKGCILRELKKRGFRITSQREILIDVILQDECSSCKEIYYKAVREDGAIGMATVYRMVKILVEAGFIRRKNMYRIDLDGICV